MSNISFIQSYDSITLDNLELIGYNNCSIAILFLCVFVCLLNMFYMSTSFIAVSPRAQANQLGNTNRLWFFKWHFHKKAVCFPMIISRLDTLALSKDDAGLSANHILVDALEEQSEHPARRHLRLRHTH